MKHFLPIVLLTTLLISPSEAATETSYQGYCHAKPYTNVRSYPTIQNNVIDNTGYDLQGVRVHLTHTFGSFTWAWVTVKGHSGWIRFDMLQGCNP